LAGKNNNFTFAYKSQKPHGMFTFQQYLGFLLFLTIFTMGFWLMIFLINFAMYWLVGANIEAFKERRAKKRHEAQQSVL
jgi:uncharacterized membrane protein